MSPAGLSSRLINRISKFDAANLFQTLAGHWRLFVPWLVFASRLAPYGLLARRDAELVILRVAWNCRARYEWGHHTDLGMAAGLTLEEVERVRVGSAAPGWSERQSALIDAADEFHDARLISDATWARLSQIYDDRELIELCMLIGHYEMLAGVLNSIGVELDAPLVAKLERASAGRAGVTRPAP